MEGYPICKKLGNQIKFLREKQNLTQDELASRADISLKYLQNLESNNPKKASIVTVEKLAKAFGLPLWKFLQFHS
jgi:transcriptional regulator with XRE-family HTH domain